jgi:hypothetical protein
MEFEQQSVANADPLPVIAVTPAYIRLAGSVGSNWGTAGATN